MTFNNLSPDIKGKGQSAASSTVDAFLGGVTGVPAFTFHGANSEACIKPYANLTIYAKFAGKPLCVLAEASAINRDFTQFSSESHFSLKLLLSIINKETVPIATIFYVACSFPDHFLQMKTADPRDILEGPLNLPLDCGIKLKRNRCAPRHPLSGFFARPGTVAAFATLAVRGTIAVLIALLAQVTITQTVVRHTFIGSIANSALATGRRAGPVRRRRGPGGLWCGSLGGGA